MPSEKHRDHTQSHYPPQNPEIRLQVYRPAFHFELFVNFPPNFHQIFAFDCNFCASKVRRDSESTFCTFDSEFRRRDSRTPCRWMCCTVRWGFREFPRFLELNSRIFQFQWSTTGKLKRGDKFGDLFLCWEGILQGNLINFHGFRIN